MKRVLDADVLIGARDGSDAHRAEARSLLTAWHGRDELSISVVNLSEVLVAPAVESSASGERVGRSRLGVQIHQPGVAIGVAAARLRQTHPISLPDAYCLATTRQTGASLASFDGKVVRAARAERIGLASSSTPTPQTPRSRRGRR